MVKNNNSIGYIYALTMGSESQIGDNSLRIEYMSFSDLLNMGYQYIGYIGMSYCMPSTD